MEVAKTTEKQIETLHLEELSDIQKARFSRLCADVREGLLTMNQAYKFAQMDGDQPDQVGFKGTFEQWISIITKAGWAPENKEDTSLNDTDEKSIDAQTEPEKKEVKHDHPSNEKKKYIVPILIGVGVGIVIIAVIANKNKNK